MKTLPCQLPQEITKETTMPLELSDRDRDQIHYGIREKYRKEIHGLWKFFALLPVC